MVKKATVFCLTQPTQLIQWQNQGVLFHQPSHTTTLVNPLMFQALENLQSGPKSINEIVDNFELAGEIDPSEIFQHIEEGFTSLQIEGILVVQ
ncbi:hypothetical protein [Pleionea sp. CnH1-48]|uniref:hypothetical protein n=1 Tax=Pleionea sp. CnH1-48 TaxID=2954494 RepID=UPI0020979DF3|nr:hypothetical protein [Pleionea sp. CnH1-48]MCO7227118.1 hypothetical protein [Pleionea sp. CnH1-48]